jgi:hypothetical protein
LPKEKYPKSTSIYTQTKVSGQGSLELALTMKKKERKKE